MRSRRRTADCTGNGIAAAPAGEAAEAKLAALADRLLWRFQMTDLDQAAADFTNGLHYLPSAHAATAVSYR